MVLAKRVRDLRYARGWSPEDLAGRARISRTALYQIESGKTEMPHAATLRRIAQALGTTPETLLNDPEPEPLSVPPDEGATRSPAVRPSVVAAESPRTSAEPMDRSPLFRDLELEHQFRILLASPLREGIARIVEESYQLLPESVRVEVETRRRATW